MELINITNEELATIRAYYEGTQAFNELLQLSQSNMNREDLELSIDMLFCAMRDSLLKQYDFFDEIKKKYSISDVCYCSKDGLVYGRV